MPSLYCIFITCFFLQFLFKLLEIKHWRHTCSFCVSVRILIVKLTAMQGGACSGCPHALIGWSCCCSWVRSQCAHLQQVIEPTAVSPETLERTGTRDGTDTAATQTDVNHLKYNKGFRISQHKLTFCHLSSEHPLSSDPGVEGENTSHTERKRCFGHQKIPPAGRTCWQSVWYE